VFTGIIQAIGRVLAIEPKGVDARLCLHTGKLDLKGARLGDSIAVDGVCLTAVELSADRFWADVSGETLARTSLGRWTPGREVNLEPALTLQTPLGGHLVSGHVDGVGQVLERGEEGRSVRFRIAAPQPLARYIAEKGSICVDGVSLTVNRVAGAAFEVNLVPHTLRETTLGGYHGGREVNLEVDIIARYLERMMMGGSQAAQAEGITYELLARYGFTGKRG
jgi:riboflavin synthase